MNHVKEYKSPYFFNSFELALGGRLPFFKKLYDLKHPLIRVKLGSRNIVLLRSLSAVQEVMVFKYKNFEKRTNFVEAFGQNVFTSSGEIWAKYRRPLMPLFSSKMFEGQFSKMRDIIQQTVKEDLCLEDQPVVALDFLSKLIFKLNAHVLVGVQLDHHYKVIHDDLVFINEYLSKKNYRLFKKAFFYKKEDENFQQKVVHLNHLIKAAALKSGESNKDSALFRLLEKNNFNIDDDLINQIKTLIFAGYETSSLTLSWFFYFLSQDEKLQEELFLELSLLDFEKIEELERAPILHSTLLEVLRHRPVGWALTRYAINDDEIDGFKIKANDCLFISPFLIHHDENNYVHPEEFNPKRFLDLKEEDYQLTFLSFGMGPRRCVGETLSMIQMKLILHFLLTQFIFKYHHDHPIDVRPETTLMFKEPFKMHIIPRKKR